MSGLYEKNDGAQCVQIDFLYFLSAIFAKKKRIWYSDFVILFFNYTNMSTPGTLENAGRYGDEKIKEGKQAINN